MNTKAPLRSHIEANRLAVLLDVSVRWVKDKVKSGELVGYRLGKRICVDSASVDKFLEARRLGAI
jgi:excisionase family DNA binding protein